MRRKLAAGNWKMHGTFAALTEIDALAGEGARADCDIVICPPATLLSRAVARAGAAIALGGQDCHAAEAGAHTGDVSAPMLADAGARYVILGHSERRADHGETDESVRAKAEAARAAGLTVILCVGESAAVRDAGTALDLVGRQLARSIPEGIDTVGLVIAYEPVWAIGSGRTPSSEQIGEMHGFLRRQITQRFGSGGEEVSLLYGGSVKAANAAEIFAVEEVDGALVGGASLKAADFVPIVAALAGCG